MPELLQRTEIGSTPAPELWGGVECTINRVGDTYYNQLRRSQDLLSLENLGRIATLGIRKLRFPILWEQLAPDTPEQIDWTDTDTRLASLRQLGITPIAGLVHHGSGPRYTDLTDPNFPNLLADYARKVAERYPWITDWTPINEPLTTARFSCLYGHWYPHRRDPAAFCRALLNQIRGIVLSMQAIREVIPNARLVQTEDLGETTCTPGLEYQAEFENERRWLSFDLLTGNLARTGLVYPYLRGAGIEDEELAWFAENPSPPDIIGINHYITSNRYLDGNVQNYAPEQHGGNGRDVYVDVEAVRAHSGWTPAPQLLLRQTWERYRRPVAVTEAHLGCTREEQLRWLAEFWRAAEWLRRENVPVVAVTIWSLFGAYDWNSLLTRADGHYEPGVFDQRSSPPRCTALGHLVQELATTGTPSSPLIHTPGWWRRGIRFLPKPDQEGPMDRVRKAFTPLAGNRTSTPCPPILITGATGTLGQAFARICYLRGLPFRLLSRAELDIADANSVEATLRAFQPWAVINAAGYVRVDDAESDEHRCHRENTCGPEILAAACARRDMTLLTFSSDLVFDGQKGSAYTESDPRSPLNVYGRSKAAAESRVLKQHPGALVIRTSAFFGPWDEHNFVTHAVARLRKGEPMMAAEDLFVSPTYVPDLVHASLDLLIDREHGLWHLANKGEVSWAELARQAAHFAREDVSLVQGCGHEVLAYIAPRPRRSVLGSERGCILGCWHDALQRYFRERPDNLRSTAQPLSGREECVA